MYLRSQSRKSIHLSSPTITNNTPLLNTLALTQLLHNLRNARQGLWWCGLGLEELTELLLLLLVVRWVPRDVRWFSLEKVRHEDLVSVPCEDIGALESLLEEAKDIVDDEDALFRIFGTRDIFKGERVC